MRRVALLLLPTVVIGLLVISPSVAAAQSGSAAPSGTAVLAQSADPSPPPAEDTGGCDTLGIGLSQLCSGVTGAIGGGMDAVVTGGAKAALSAVVDFVVDGAGWLLGQLAGVIDTSTRPDVTSGWFQAAYGDMATIALLGLLPFLLLSVVQGIVKQDVGQLLRSTFLYVPVAALGTGAAVVVVDMLVTITDSLSLWIGRSMGSDLSAFATGLGTALATLSAPNGGAAAGFAGLIAAAAVAFSTFVIWLELLLRQAAIYVAVLFLPLGFMALVWPATAHWLRRLVQGLVAIILSKFVIISIMALAATALQTTGQDGFAVVIAGAALLGLAALAPYVLLRLIPVFEAGLSTQLEGTLRRPTAAVAAPSASRGTITQMLRQRVGRLGSGSGSVGGQPAAALAGAGGGSTPLAAVRSSAGGTGAGGAAAAAGPAAAAGVGLVTAGAGAARRAASRSTSGTADVAAAATSEGGAAPAATAASRRPEPAPRQDTAPSAAPPPHGGASIPRPDSDFDTRES